MAPSEPGHAIVRYRKLSPSLMKAHFCTGYSTIYQAKRDENKEKCIIYQLPPEILLSIMKCLDAPSLYVARQACSLMWSFYYDFSFKSFHYVLKDKQGNIVPGALPGFIHYAIYGHKSDIVKRLRSDQLCPRRHVWTVSEACRLRSDQLRPRHPASIVSETSRLRSDQLHPRHHVSIVSEACRLLRIRHTIKVATLTMGQVVTMDLLRQSLERIPIDGLLCSHARAPQEILMKPFCRRRCVCFRESTGTVQRCYGHPRPRERYDCCACLQMFSEDEAAVGMFMASAASHGVRCAGCDIHYVWTLDGDKVLLSVKRPFLYVLCAAVSVYWRMLRDVCDWIFRWIWSCVMGLSKCLE